MYVLEVGWKRRDSGFALQILPSAIRSRVSEEKRGAYGGTVSSSSV